MLVCVITRVDEEFALVLDVVSTVVGNVVVPVLVSGEALRVGEVLGASVLEMVVVGDAVDDDLLVSTKVVGDTVDISPPVDVITIVDEESVVALKEVPAVVGDADMLVLTKVVGVTVDVSLTVDEDPVLVLNVVPAVGGNAVVFVVNDAILVAFKVVDGEALLV